MAWKIPLSISTSATAVPLGSTDSVFVAQGVVVVSTNSFAIDGFGDNHQVIVAGTVATTASSTIILGQSTSSTGQIVRIEATGDVRCFGENYAVNLLGTGSQFTNAGYVFSNQSAVVLQSIGSATGASIVNTGVMEAGSSGIVVSSFGLDVVNFSNSGRIAAPTAYDSSTDFAVDIVTNTGTLSGDVQLRGRDDIYNGEGGNLLGRLFAGGGNDTARGGRVDDYFDGGSGNDTLFGNGGGDRLFGREGNDRIYGNAGNDFLNSGPGADRLYGGTGNDIFTFEAPLASGNADRIYDFANRSGNNDTIRLENAVMTKLGAFGKLNAAFFKACATAADANDHVIYNKATGVLSYDANGSASGGVTVLATLTTKPTLTPTDFFVI